MDASPYAGEFHGTLYRVLGETQFTAAENIARIRGENENTIRTHFHERGWKKEDQPFCLVERDYQARLYPYLPDFVRWLEGAPGTKKAPRAAETIAFIRYRFLKDAHALGLYRPFSEGRLASLLTWMYLPDIGSPEQLASAQKASFVLAFNNDVQLYRHMTVLVDRMIHNKVNQVFLRPLLPRLGLLMILFGDYQWSIDVCDLALNQAKENRGAKNPFIVQELEIVRADASSHLMIPVDLDPCRQLYARVRLLVANSVGADGSLDGVDADRAAILRMALCAYFRALVRVVMYLRTHRKDYELTSRTEEFLDLYRRLAERNADEIDATEGTEPPKSADRLCSGRHYVGLDYDTLARAESVLRPEILLQEAYRKRPDPRYKQRPGDLVRLCRDAIKARLDDADVLMKKAILYFREGDEEDQIALDTFELPDVSLVPQGVRVDNLSTYRCCSTGVIVHCYEAMFAVDQTAFRAALLQAEGCLEEFEKKVGIENLRHARILSERLKSMISLLAYPDRFGWIARTKWMGRD